MITGTTAGPEALSFPCFENVETQGAGYHRQDRQGGGTTLNLVADVAVPSIRRR